MDKGFQDFAIYDRNGNEQKNIYGKEMNSTMNKQENNSTSTLEFGVALAMASYPQYILDFIKKFLLDNYSNNDLANVYMFENINRENIFVIEYTLVIEFNLFYILCYYTYILILYRIQIFKMQITLKI